MISMTREYVSESMSRSGSESYWSWAPESFTIVLGRKNSLQDATNVSQPSSPTVSMSRSSTIRPNPQSSQPATPICVSQPLTTGDSSTTTTTIHNAPVPVGLGIFGLNNINGASFDGAGIFGLCEEAKSTKSAHRRVSFAPINDTSLIFSSPLRNPALQRVFATRFATPAMAARTPTPYPHEFMEAAGGEYFPMQNASGLTSPLQHVFTTRTLAARIPTPYPRNSMETAGGEYFPQQSVGLGSPARTPLAMTRFPTPTLAVRTPTPYPHEFMEAAGGEYFPIQSVRFASPLQRVSAISTFARIPTPYPRNSMETAGGEYFPQQSVGLCSPARTILATTPTLAVRTPTPYPHEFMEAAGGEYFQIQSVRFASPLQRASAISTFARIPTPYPRYSMEVAGGEYFPVQNVRFASPLQSVFAMSTFAARIPTPYPRYTTEAAGGEYFPESESNKLLQHPSLQRVLATRVGPPTLAARTRTRTPTPYPHNSMEADGGEYFPQQPLQRKNAGLGLGISGLAKSDGGSFDGMGIVGLQKFTGNVQEVSRALIEEVACTFSSTAHPLR